MSRRSPHTIRGKNRQARRVGLWVASLSLLGVALSFPDSVRACPEGPAGVCSASSATLGNGAGPLAATAPNPLKIQGLTGVGSVCQMFMGFDFIPGIQTYWERGLDWIVSTKIPQTHGATWEAFVDGPPGTAGIYGHPTAAWNAQALAEGWMRNGKPAYLQAALEAMDWLNHEWVPMSNYSPPVTTPQGYVYLETHPAVPTVHYFSNTVWNQLAIGQSALDVYLVTGDQNALDVARGIADALVATADPMTVGYSWRTYWPANHYHPNDNAHYLQRCAGGPGISEFLIRMANDVPQGLWNNDYASYARGSLAWLASHAIPVPGGATPCYKWPSEDSLSGDSAYVTQGRGVAGIGRAFLQAYLAFGDSAYRDYAVGAAHWLIQVSVLVPATGRHWDNFLVNAEPFKVNNSWCIGHQGIAQFLGDTYAATKSRTIGQAYLESAAWLNAQTVPTAFGPMYPRSQSGDYNNNDFFFGFTGLGNYHWETIPSIWTYPPAVTVNVNALNFLINSAVDQNGTLTWPWVIPFAGYGGSAAPNSSTPTLTVSQVAQPVPVSWPEEITWPEEEVFQPEPGFSVLPNPVRGSTRIRFDRAGAIAGNLAGGSIAEGSSAARGTAARLQITDVSGRIVRVLVTAAAGSMLEWSWDARDDSGRPVPQGMYFGRLIDAGSIAPEATRIAVLN